jgi:hypothetical protein
VAPSYTSNFVVVVLNIASPATAVIALRSVVVMRGNKIPLVVLLTSIAATALGAEVLPNMVPPTKLFVVLAPVWYMPFAFALE